MLIKMKKTLIVIGALLIIALLFSVIYFKDIFKSNSDNIKVKDISIVTKVDTISYALGFVWAKNIEKHVGIRNITYAFYSGVQDYIIKDTSIMGAFGADMYLQSQLDKIKSDSVWPVNDENMNLNEIELVTKQDSFCYALGFSWCAGAYGIGIKEISPALMLGLLKGLKGDTSLFKNYVAANAYLMTYVDELQLKKFGDIKKTNEDWLKENGKNKGIQTLASGVQYKIVKSGNGLSPTDSDIVECHYIGKLIDGKVFDNAYQDGPTFRFYISSVIAGWGEAIKLMKEGDEWIIYIPYNLAYGSGGMGDLVPPYATVMLDVELVKVTKGAE
jgi:FKBP-type peptidyl-prolyl cis-trans isomerase FklB